MDANPRTLHELFSWPCQYVIPLFQRRYTWNQADQWEPLWDDLSDLVVRGESDQHVPPHFLGAVVFDQIPTAAGSMPLRQVIDGQQRLTTLQLLMAALRDVAAASGFDRHAAAVDQLVVNNDPLAQDEDAVYKVLPTIADRKWFRLAVGKDPVEVRRVAAELPAPERALDGYLYFFDTMRTWLDGEQESVREGSLDRLVRVLREKVVLVAIDLSRDDNAQAIFEVLNDRGAPLNPSDLVKNLLFQQAQREGADVEKLNDRYWSGLSTSYWAGERRQGRLLRPVLDLFLNQYIANRALQDVRAQDVYSAFKRWATDDGLLSAEARMADVAALAERFKWFEEIADETPEGRFLQRLRTELDTAAPYPLLFELYDMRDRGEITAEELDQMLLLIESYLFRRIIVRWQTKRYNRFFIEILRSVRLSDDPPGVVLRRALVRKGGAMEDWPSDADVTATLVSGRSYGGIRRDRLGLLLRAVNDHLRGDRTESISYGNLQVEHLMPQSWAEHWPLPSGGEYDHRQERNGLVNTVGNLTLITAPLNQSISNGPWEAKRAAILEHSALTINRSLPEEWTHDAIRERSATIARAVCEIWPTPDGGAE